VRKTLILLMSSSLLSSPFLLLPRQLLTHPLLPPDMGMPLQGLTTLLDSIDFLLDFDKTMVILSLHEATPNTLTLTMSLITIRKKMTQLQPGSLGLVCTPPHFRRQQTPPGLILWPRAVEQHGPNLPPMCIISSTSSLMEKRLVKSACEYLNQESFVFFSRPSSGLQMTPFTTVQRRPLGPFAVICTSFIL
jgi:hypothetical protein